MRFAAVHWVSDVRASLRPVQWHVIRDQALACTASSSAIRASSSARQALKNWLVQQDPPLANEIFLDADMMRPGLQWKDQLRQAMKNCEAVICLMSANWPGSPECLAEFRTAEYLNKRIFCARLEPSDLDVEDITAPGNGWICSGAATDEIPLDDQSPPLPSTARACSG